MTGTTPDATSPVLSGTNQYGGGASVQPPQTSGPKSSRKSLLLLVAVLVLVAIAAGVFYVLRKQEGGNTSQSSQSSQEQSLVSEVDQEQTGLKNVEFVSGLAVKSKVRAEVPVEWQVESYEQAYADGMTLNAMVISSQKGNHLHIYDRDGLGGFCESDTESFTLTKVLPIKTSGFAFMEFHAPSVPTRDKVLILSTLDGRAIENMQEGDTLTDTCKMPAFSSFSNSSVFAELYDAAGKNLQNAKRLGWDDIKDDADFVKVLQSLEFEEK